MKKYLLIALLAVIGATTPASAQFRFGVKAGMAVNSLHFDSSTFDSDNRAGFTGGVMAEYTVPVLGLGLDLSAMYVRRNTKFMEDQNLHRDNRDYIDVPLNVKWKINVPVINNIARPYLFTGPCFSFLTSRKAVEGALRNRSFDTSWNFGVGLEVLKHVQVGASYGLGITKALKSFGTTGSGAIEGHNRYWTVTAAYLF